MADKSDSLKVDNCWFQNLMQTSPLVNLGNTLESSSPGSLARVRDLGRYPSKYANLKGTIKWFEFLEKKFGLERSQLWTTDSVTEVIFCHPIVLLDYGQWVSLEFKLISLVLNYFLEQSKNVEILTDQDRKRLCQLTLDFVALQNRNSNLEEENGILSKKVNELMAQNAVLCETVHNGEWEGIFFVPKFGKRRIYQVFSLVAPHESIKDMMLLKMAEALDVEVQEISFAEYEEDGDLGTSTGKVVFHAPTTVTGKD